MSVFLVHVNQHHSSKEDRFSPIKINATYANSGLCYLNLFQEESVKGARTVLELVCKWVGSVSWQGGNSSSYLPPLFVRACGKELCWNLAVQKHSPQIFQCQLQRLTGGTDGTFPGNYNIMLFPIRNTAESWLGDLSTTPSRWLGRKLLWNRLLTTGTRFPVKAEILTWFFIR